MDRPVSRRSSTNDAHHGGNLGAGPDPTWLIICTPPFLFGCTRYSSFDNCPGTAAKPLLWGVSIAEEGLFAIGLAECVHQGAMLQSEACGIEADRLAHSQQYGSYTFLTDCRAYDLLILKWISRSG